MGHVNIICSQICSSNLKALYWAGNRANGDFGRHLARICPRLEHIYFRDLSCFEHMMESYTRCLEDVHVSCLHLGEDDEDVAADFDKKMLEFLKDCPQLETFINCSKFNTIELNRSLMTRLRKIQVYPLENVQKFVLVLIKNGHCLKHLAIIETINREQLESICNSEMLQGLKSVVLTLNPNYIETLCSLQELNDVYLSTASTGHGYDETIMRSFLVKKGMSLRSLSLASCDLLSSAFQNIATTCPNLVNFSYYSAELPCLDDNIFIYLGALKYLTSVRFSDTRITPDGVRKLLSSCTRLKEMALIMFDVDGAMLDQFKVYARRYPKRTITLEVDYNLLKDRKDRKFIKVFDNLRVCYVH
jgi:hypothetical protein